MDIVAFAVQASAKHAIWAPALAALAGIVTSFGPCVAPRFIGVAAMLAGRTRVMRWGLLGAFLVGLCGTYVLAGVAAGFAGLLARQTSAIYAALALVLACGGCAALLRSPHRHGGDAVRGASHGGAFLMGGSFALIASPCCTPLLASLAAVTAASGSAWFGAATLGAFAFGHALPLLAAGAGSGRIVDFCRRWDLEPAMSTVGGGLMLALAGYYGLLV